jgi:hypothetical protein
MAKRKHRPGGGSKLRPIKNYRDDEYVPYIFRAESGILQAWAIDPDLRDGDVRQALRNIIASIKRSNQLPEFLTQPSTQSDEAIDAGSRGVSSMLEYLILSNLRRAFEEYDPLDNEDTVGILTVINNSVGAWNRGMRGQEYLKYIQGFLGGMGVFARRLTEEEVENLEFYRLEDRPDDPIEGEYREIK